MRAKLMYEDGFQGINCRKLAIAFPDFTFLEPSRFAPITLPNTTKHVARGIFALVSHCKELEEFGVVPFGRDPDFMKGMQAESCFKSLQVACLGARDKVRHRLKECAALQGQRIPEVVVWGWDGKKINSQDT